MRAAAEGGGALVGVGEGPDDLVAFDPDDFAAALTGV